MYNYRKYNHLINNFKMKLNKCEINKQKKFNNMIK